jgi:hypothetical protein
LDAARLPTVPVNKGGTGATTAAAARTNLGAASTWIYKPLPQWQDGRMDSTNGWYSQTVSVSGILALTPNCGCSANRRVLKPTANLRCLRPIDEGSG